MPSHARAKTSKHRCDECGKETNSASDLIVHMRVRTHERPFKCGQCAYASAQISNLRIHQRTHTGICSYGTFAQLKYPCFLAQLLFFACISSSWTSKHTL